MMPPYRYLYGGIRRLEEQACKLSRRLQLYSIQHAIVFGEERRLLNRNAALAGLYRGRRAFVLGNGPSLARLDLEHLRGEVVFTTNDFGCHPVLDRWTPSMHCLVDPQYFSEPEKFATVFGRLRARMPGTRFVLPVTAARLVQSRGLLDVERCYFLRFVANVGIFHDLRLDPCKPIPGGQTVTLVALMMALFAGCNPIYLLGMDMDFLASPKQQRHFSPQYEADVKNCVSYTDFNYLTLIECVRLMFLGFQTLSRVAASRGQSIFNASGGGFLDVFEARDFASLFQADPQLLQNTEDK